MKNANILLYLNLAGEVFYIIVHRMKSQKVKDEHQERVRNDIAVAICHTTVIQNLLKGSLQILNLKLSDVRILMDRIVHSSIMTVNAFSMEKLFELTLIATKYQYTTCQYPSDILPIALNHLDTIRRTVTDPTAKSLAENLHNTIYCHFHDVDIRTMQTYRYLILSYLADVKLKMTNLIRLGLQRPTGDFVKQFPDKVKRTELNQPGLIQVFTYAENDEGFEISCDCGRLCNCDGFDDEETLSLLSPLPHGRPLQVHESNKTPEILSLTFKEQLSSMKARVPLKISLALNGNRGVFLGQSIYEIEGNCDDVPIQNGSSDTKTGDKLKSETEADAADLQKESSSSEAEKHYFVENSDFYATKGLDLCSVLLGCDPNETSTSIPNDSSEETETNSSTTQVVSASALGLESVLEHFPSMGFNKTEDSASSEGHDDNEPLYMNPKSINVIKFDARSDTAGNKAALVAIAQDFFELEAEEKAQDGEKYRSKIDDLFEGFDFSDD